MADKKQGIKININDGSEQAPDIDDEKLNLEQTESSETGDSHDENDQGEPDLKEENIDVTTDRDDQSNDQEQDDAGDDEQDLGSDQKQTTEQDDEPEESDNLEPDSQDLDPEEKQEVSHDDVVDAFVNDEALEQDDDELVERPEWDDEEFAKLSKPRQLMLRVKRFFKDPKKRYSFIGAATSLAIITLLIIPFTRFGLFNLMGMRATAEIMVQDEESSALLTNVTVRIGDAQTTTDLNGIARFTSIKLGDSTMSIDASGYETLERKFRVERGHNNFDIAKVQPRGSKITVNVTDFLSSEAIEGAVVSYQDVGTTVSADGNAIVSVGDVSGDLVLKVEAEQYRSEELNLNSRSQKAEVQLVPAQLVYFISERDGGLDLYGIAADGSEEKLLAEGDSAADKSSRLAVSQDGRTVIWVTKMQNVQTSSGYLKDVIVQYDLNDEGELEMRDTPVDVSERIDMIGFTDNKLVYVKIAEGASGRNPERHRLISYDVKTGELKQIEASNYFNDVVVAGNYVFYAPSDAWRSTSKDQLYRTDLSGENKQSVYDQEVWSIFRTNVNEIQFDARGSYFRTGLDPLAPVSIPKINNDSTLVYYQGPENQLAYVDVRDGKGNIIVVDTETGKEEIIAKVSGAKPPLRWLSDTHLVFRVDTDSETADYVINVDTGDHQKVVDVTNIRGIDRWYYYY